MTTERQEQALGDADAYRDAWFFRGRPDRLAAEDKLAGAVELRIRLGEIEDMLQSLRFQAIRAVMEHISPLVASREGAARMAADWLEPIFGGRIPADRVNEMLGA